MIGGQTMSIINTTDLKENLFSYLDDVIVNDERIIVTTKSGKAAIISEEYLNSLEETCYLCKVPGMMNSIEEGTRTSLSECHEVDWQKRLK